MDIYLKDSKGNFILLTICTYLLFIGGVYFIPNIIVDRFHALPFLWIEGLTGIIGVIYTKYIYKKTIQLPPIPLCIILIIWFIFQLYHSSTNIYAITQLGVESFIFIIAYTLCTNSHNIRSLYFLYFLLSISIAVIGISQYIGISPSFNSKFIVGGTFDNPAGYSALLASTFPFIIYFNHKNTYKPLVYLGISILLLGSILSEARASLLSITIIFMLSIKLKILRCQSPNKANTLLLIIIGIIFVIGLYIIKPNSANGRLIIWRCCLDLIIKHPILGYGYESFKGYYMSAQASFLSNDVPTAWKLLTSNIFHPLNEYLKIIIEQGLLGFTIILSIFACSFFYYKEKRNKEKDIAVLSIVGIGVCSFFSYPLSYPIIRLLLIFSLAILTCGCKTRKEKYIKIGRKYIAAIYILSISLIINTTYQGYYEFQWKESTQGILSENNSYFSLYQNLYNHTFFHKNPEFIYNYGVRLYENGKYNKSIQIFKESIHIINDYDTQMLLGYNFKKLNEPYNAIKHFKIAFNMIPYRLTPLYEQLKIYKDKGDVLAAKHIATKILNMPIKILSAEVLYIRSDAESLLQNINHYKRKEVTNFKKKYIIH